MDYFKRIIHFFTTGAFSETGKQAFFGWLSDEEHSGEKDRVLKELWDHTDHKANAKTRDSWRTLRRNAGLQDMAPRRQRLRVWQAAAAVLLVFSLSAVYTAYRIKRDAPSSDLLEQYVPVAATEHVVLPDGSEVHLNSGSLLLYPGRFTGKSRSVYLSGEANFRVTKDKDKPFIVKSSDFQVTVLGTEFDLHAYPEDSLVRVTLLSGSVEAAYDDLNSHTVLSPSQQLVYNRNSGSSYIARPDIAYVTAWQRGEIILQGTTLSEVITVLKRKYPYTFVYHEGQFSDDKYTFNFKEDAPLTEVMEVIARVVGYIRYEVVDDTCIIGLK